MGNDGGSIPRRDELVRLKKKPEEKDKDSERQYRWKHCALTQQRLQKPIVMCGLGRLYSKQHIIEYLLEKKKMPDSCKHIKSLKDVKNLNLTANPSYTPDADVNESCRDTRNAEFICALIGLEMSGTFRFVGLWSCGCVFSERALKEIKSNTCSVCQTPFTEQDIVILNGNEEDITEMQVKLEIRNKLSKKQKQDKKSKTVVKTEPETETSETTIKTEPGKMSKLKLSTMTAYIKNKRAIICDKISDDPVFKKSKDNYSVAEDPQATDVYKSLFTSHSDDKSQERAHWVTYNPFYN